MKKKTRFFCVILALAMILTLPSASLVFADSTKTYVTLYPSKDAKVKKLLGIDEYGTATLMSKNQCEVWCYAWYNALTTFSSGTNLYEVKSSETSILSVNKKKSIVSPPTGVLVPCTVKKTGTTKVSVKVGNTKKETETWSTTVKVAKYINPLESVKLNGKTISGKKFNKTSVLQLSYKDYANKKITLKSLKLKGNWICTSGSALVTPKGSGYKASYVEGNGTFKITSASLPKITKKGSWIELVLQNTETAQDVTLTILFK